MGMSLVSAALKMISVRPLSTTPSTFPSSASAGAAKANGTTAAIKRVDSCFMILHLWRDYWQTLHTERGSNSHTGNIFLTGDTDIADLSETENVLVTNYLVSSCLVSPGLR